MEDIRYLRSIDQKNSMAKTVMAFALLFALVITLSSFFLYKNALDKNLDKPPLIMDKNGIIVRTSDQYQDGYETIGKKALIKLAHEKFFTIEPDDKQIKRTLTEAQYLGDFKPIYEHLKENNFYNEVVQRNLIQYVETDSCLISHDGNSGRFYGKVHLKSSNGTTVTKVLVTQFPIVKREITENNLYGFYCDNISIISNALLSEAHASKKSEYQINGDLLPN